MNWKQKKKLADMLIMAGIVIVVIVSALACCGAKEAESIPEPEWIEYAGTEEYTVEAFDTLSHIAVKYIPDDEYMQQWIEDVKRLNGRKTSDIYFGEVIRVYVYE